MSVELLLTEFDRIVHAPDALEGLRPFVVQLALRGELTSSEAERLDAEPVSLERIHRGMATLLHSRSQYRWTRTTVPTQAGVDTPHGWCATELANTGLYINGLPFKPSDWGTKGRPIIRIQNLSGLNRDYNYTDRDCPKDNQVESGDLLVSWSATLDTFLWDGPQAVLNQHIFKVVPNPEAVTREFLYWLLKHEVRALARSQHAHGLAMMHINRGPFLSHTVLLPPLPEQHRIVAKVHQFMALCDQLEAALNEREARQDGLHAASLWRLTSNDEDPGASAADVAFFLEQSPRLMTKPAHVTALRQTILDLAVLGRLVPEDPVDNASPPNGWRPLREVLDLITDGDHATPPRIERNEDAVPLVTAKNVRDGFMDLSVTDWVTRATATKSWHRCHPAPGDILIVCVGATIGRLCVLRDAQDMVLVRSVALLRPNEQVLAVFLAHCLRSPILQRQIWRSVKATGQPCLYLGRIQELTVPVPPLGEQRRIVAKVDGLMKLCDDLQRALASAQKERVRLLESLLHDALNGAALLGAYGGGLTASGSERDSVSQAVTARSQRLPRRTEASSLGRNSAGCNSGKP